ncbi:MAG: hypothetical protein HS116_01265 [Planctomycetes bacterium]|nr:hypothetical protein [Planctomycetota bacterium]
MKSKLVIGLAVLALSLWGIQALADGPHWHVPNPDSEEYSDGDETKPPAVPAGGGGAANAKNADWAKNPGNFFLLDQPCIDYYERHCVIKYNKNDLDFYLLIMNRCAQAMREVDNYLPCPDSFPLWHTEELRELMVVYAQRTWQRSTQLKAPLNEKCAEFIVQCFTDSVRFGDDARRNALDAKVKQFFDANKELQKMLEQAAMEKDNAKKQAILKEWIAKGRDGLNKTGLSKDLAKTFATFKLVTGDIPMQVDEAEARMMEGLSKMGSIVIPYLQKGTQDKNPQVQRQCWAVLQMIQAQFAAPATGKPTMSGVLDQLNWIEHKPGSPEAARALKVLKNMGDEAIKHLIQIARSENLGSKKAIALGALAHVAGRNYGSDLKKYEAYLAEREGKAAEEKAAKVEAKKSEEGGMGGLENVLDGQNKKTQPAVQEEE